MIVSPDTKYFRLHDLCNVISASSFLQIVIFKRTRKEKWVKDGFIKTTKSFCRLNDPKFPYKSITLGLKNRYVIELQKKPWSLDLTKKRNKVLDPMLISFRSFPAGPWASLSPNT